MKILITGADGFIDYTLFEELKEKYTCIGIDLTNHKNNKIIRCDITKSEEIEELFNRHTENYTLK